MKKSKLRVFEAFSGIGAQRKALENLGIDHEVVAISEIDKHAIASYEAMFGETLNVGDITTLDPHDTKKVLLTLWQDLDDVRQLHNVKVTMDAGGFAYGAYKATEYAQKRVAKAYKELTGEDLP